MVNAVVPTRKRALEIGANFIENDLAKMRDDARRHDEQSTPTDGRVWPITHCLEHDIMKCMEWGIALGILKEMAKHE